MDICKRCGQKKIIHAKNLCASCYNNVYHSENNKAYSQRKTNQISLVTYKKLTEKCVICGFDRIVDIFHIDLNKKNNELSNLIGLCPNHHRMADNYKYRFEIYESLKDKGISIPFTQKDLFYMNQTKQKSPLNSQNKGK